LLYYTQQSFVTHIEGDFTMKKLILAAVLVASIGVPALPAHAQSANDWIRYQQATDPAYNRDRWWGYGYNSYQLPFIPYFHDTEKKGGSKKEFNGRDLQYCRSSQWGPAGWVEPGQPCPVVGQQEQGPQPAEATSSTYVENYQDETCLVTQKPIGPNGERGVIRDCHPR
jgi:hypothetical protein